MSRMSDITAKLLEAMTWDYQSQESLYELLIPSVPPGRAIRQYEYRQSQEEKKRIKRGGPAERVKPELSQSEQIYSGARDLVRASIGSLISGGIIERSDVDGQPFLRRKDRRKAAPIVQRNDGACEECGRPFVKGRIPDRPQLNRPQSNVIWLPHIRNQFKEAR